MKIHLIEALIILITLNFVTIIFMICQFYGGAAISAVIAAIFTWSNVNNEILGKELRDFLRK
jgi:hypothetical protein